MTRIIFLIALFVATSAHALGLNLGLGFQDYQSPTEFVFQQLSSIEGLDVECDFDATHIDSYDGTGTVWSSLDGLACAMDVTGATFTGTAGNQAAYWDVDDGEYFTIQTNPQFVDDMVNSGQDSDWWWAMAGRSGDSPQAGGYTMIMGATRTGTPDFQLAYNPGEGFVYRSDTTGGWTILDENDVAFLPNTDFFFSLSYDDSANKLYIRYNDHKAWVVDADFSHSTAGAGEPLRLFSSGSIDLNDNNWRLYSFAGGQGLLTDAQGTGIFDIWENNHGRDYGCGGADGEDSVNCIKGLVLNVQAANSASWDNVGNDWNSLVSSPNDGGTQAGYQFTVSGFEYVGTVGTTGSYFLTSPGDYASLTISTNTPLLRHSTDWSDPYNTHLWCSIGVKTAATNTGSDYALWGNATNEGGIGIGLEKDAITGDLVVRARYPASEDHGIPSTLQDDRYFVITTRSSPQLGISSGNGNGHITQGYRINSTEIDGIQNFFAGSMGVAGKISNGDFVIGATYNGAVVKPLPDGWRIYGKICGNEMDTPAIASRVGAYFETQMDYDVDYNGRVGSYDPEDIKLAARHVGSTTEFAAADGGGLNGLKLSLSPSLGNSFRIRGIAVMVGTDNIMNDLTRVTFADGNTFANVSAGEYTVSNFSGLEVDLENWNNGDAMFNDSGATMDVFIEFASPIVKEDIDSIQICAATTGSYFWDLAIEDTNGGSIALTDEPADRFDRRGDVTLDGQSCNAQEFLYTIN